MRQKPERRAGVRSMVDARQAKTDSALVHRGPSLSMVLVKRPVVSGGGAEERVDPDE